MSVKKFLAPNLAILIVLSFFWFAGVDNVVQHSDPHQTNLKKYIQAQRRILDNYVDPVNATSLYESSIRGLVSGLSDSTIKVKGTPIDTSFGNLKIDNLSKSVKKFEEAYLYVSNNYPKENMDKLTEDALRGMFNHLDPHSIYIPAKEGEQIDEEFAGKFQGIGVQFNVIRDTITVVTPISGGPSDKLGIRSGDRIVKINGKSAIGFTNQQVRNNLRGPKGTKVDVTIMRPTPNKEKDEPIHFTITRDDIPLYTIDTSYMLDNKTGYVKINRFAATTHQEFMDAMHKLKKKGMQRLILDLRGNPGGYLNQAVAIAEEFYPQGTKIVSTKSRHTRFNSAYYSRRDGSFKDEPLIILVNDGSASASEIVSGAIQDHDRGLIVGQRTFGKGLVQQQYQLADSSKIRVTIAKYYTPSGRLIQKPYSNKTGEQYAYEIYNRSNDAKGDAMQFISHVPDSLKYYTDAGRTVYGGGGIVPDHIVQEDTTHSAAVVNYMRRKQIGFYFVRNYLDEHGKEFRAKWGDDYENFRKNFTWSEQDMDKVFDKLKENNMVVSNSDTLKSPDFKSDTLYIPKGHFQKIEWMPRGILKAELANQVWGLKKYYPIINDVFDTTLKKAMNMWDEVHQLKEYAANHSAPPQKDKK
ncbi:MAG TPA: S41 family peptidase [Balneolaceae bacterium]|nr:S41 family peptidase [Balneolaceae bacterium]